MTSLTIVRRIAARPSLVWEALVTPAGLREWIGPDAGPVLVAETDPCVGGAFRLKFRMLDGSEHESTGNYLVFDPPHRLVMSWRWQGEEDDRGTSQVEITLRAIAEGSELTFTHSRLADDAAAEGHRKGWAGALNKLEGMF
jgi:uncharacterized protein YndB with AHSA1/START domain